MKYDGHDFKNDFKVEEIQRSLLPELSTTPMTSEVLDGETHLFTRISGREIRVVIRIITPVPGAKNQQRKFEQKRRQICGALLSKTPKKLVLDDAPDVYEMAVIDGATDLDRFVYTGTTTLVFRCFGPAAFGETSSEVAKQGGKLTVCVDGNTATQPVVIVTAAGPFTVTFDGEPFEVTGSVTGDVIIDARETRENEFGHFVTDNEGRVVPYSIMSDWPIWEPGTHTVECSRPFAVQWTDRWA